MNVDGPAARRQARALAREGAVIVNGRTARRVQAAVEKLRAAGVRGDIRRIAADLATADASPI